MATILTIVSVFFYVKMSHFAGSYTLNVKIHCLSLLLMMVNVKSLEF